jgi:8-oxo-dGTP pyrophosphatase MutT (NUDIX family)
MLETARVLIEGPDGVLLLRRSATSPSYAGHWELPGGKIDANEDAPSAAVRELYEETGITLERTELEPVGVLRHEDEQRVITTRVYRCRPGDAQVRLSDEHDAHGVSSRLDGAPVGEIAASALRLAA